MQAQLLLDRLMWMCHTKAAPRAIRGLVQCPKAEAKSSEKPNRRSSTEMGGGSFLSLLEATATHERVFLGTTLEGFIILPSRLLFRRKKEKRKHKHMEINKYNSFSYSHCARQERIGEERREQRESRLERSSRNSIIVPTLSLSALVVAEWKSCTVVSVPGHTSMATEFRLSFSFQPEIISPFLSFLFGPKPRQKYVSFFCGQRPSRGE